MALIGRGTPNRATIVRGRAAGADPVSVTGATLLAAATLIAGVATGGAAGAGATLLAASTFIAGTATVGTSVAGATLTATSTLVAGATTGGAALAGVTVSAAASLIGGGASTPTPGSSSSVWRRIGLQLDAWLGF